MRNHTRLRAFELTDQLAICVYQATSGFPRAEMFGLRGLESWTDSVNHRHGFAACEQVGQVLGHQAHGALGYGAQSRPISP